MGQRMHRTYEDLRDDEKEINIPTNRSMLNVIHYSGSITEREKYALTAESNSNASTGKKSTGTNSTGARFHIQA